MPSATKRARLSKGSPVTKTEIMGLQKFVGVLANCTTEKDMLQFVTQTPFFSDAFAAFGLTMNPGAKKLEDLIRPSKLLDAWSRLYIESIGDQRLKKLMLKGLSGKYGRIAKELFKVAPPPHASIMNQQGGGSRIITFIFSILLVFVTLYSATRGISAYQGEAAKHDVSVGFRVGMNVVDVLGGALMRVPVLGDAAEAVGAAKGAVADYFTDFTNIPEAMVPLLKGRVATQIVSLRRDLENIQGRQVTVIGNRALFEPYAERFENITVRYPVREGNSIRVTTIKPFQGIASRPGEMAKRFEALAKLRQALKGEIKDLEEEVEAKASTLAQARETLGTKENKLFGFTVSSTTVTPANIAPVEEQYTTAAAKLKGKQNENKGYSNEEARLLSLQTTHEQFPMALPFLPFLEPAGVGEAIHTVIRGDLLDLAAEVTGLDSAITDTSSPSSKRVLTSIQAIVKKVQELPAVAGLAAPLREAIVKHIEDSLQYGLHQQFLENLNKQAAAIQAQVESIERGISLFKDLDLIDAVKAEASRRGFELTDAHNAELNQVLDDLTRYGLEPKDVKQTARVFVDGIASKRTPRKLRLSDVPNLLESHHASEFDLFQRGLYAFITTMATWGVPLVMAYAIAMRFLAVGARAERGDGGLSIGDVQRVVRDALANRPAAAPAIANQQVALATQQLMLLTMLQANMGRVVQGVGAAVAGPAAPVALLGAVPNPGGAPGIPLLGNAAAAGAPAPAAPGAPSPRRSSNFMKGGRTRKARQGSRRA